MEYLFSLLKINQVTEMGLHHGILFILISLNHEFPGKYLRHVFTIIGMPNTTTFAWGQQQKECNETTPSFLLMLTAILWVWIISVAIKPV